MLLMLCILSVEGGGELDGLLLYLLTSKFSYCIHKINI